MRLLSVLLLLAFPFLSLSQERKPEDFAKDVVAGIEKTMQDQGEGRFVLISFINGSVEIVATVKAAKDWDDEYRKAFEEKVALTIRRGGFTFQLIQLKEREEKEDRTLI